MNITYKTISESCEVEIIEKKSRFIATLYPVSNEEEAEKVWHSIRKKNYNANHNCYAVIIGMKKEYQKCSDDGEPSGTAGKPMLDVLQGSELTNVAVVVTRYFGGTLLGTGGLVRAYQSAVRESLSNAKIIEKKAGVLCKLEMEYTNVGKVQNLLGTMEIGLIDSEYTDRVVMNVVIPSERVDSVCKKIIEATNASVQVSKGEEIHFSNDFGKIEIFYN